MNIALIGYGKMGHMLADIAKQRSHTIVCTIDAVAKDASCITNNPDTMIKSIKEAKVDGLIEFSHPSAVLTNIKTLLPLGLPIVVGTTGWHDSLHEVQELVKANNAAFLYASNFSIGVNLFYKIVEQASHIISDFENYDTAIIESHHNQKADSPSGTALELAKKILHTNPQKSKIVTDSFSRKPQQEELHVASIRIGSDPGTHSVIFDSFADFIEIKHSARNREGFALGAVHALEWLQTPDAFGKSRKGVFTMDDVLGF